MIKRPINPMFNIAVCAGIKFTTIRENPWPCWTPIMLYNWTGAAYRSKQINIAAIEVEEVLDITITHDIDGGLVYCRDKIDGKPIHQSEGFKDAGEMRQWFEKIVKPGEDRTFHLMRFRLAEKSQPTFFQDFATAAAP